MFYFLLYLCFIFSFYFHLHTNLNLIPLQFFLSYTQNSLIYQSILDIGKREQVCYYDLKKRNVRLDFKVLFEDLVSQQIKLKRNM